LKLKELRSEGKTLRNELKELLPSAQKDKNLKNDLKAIKVELKKLYQANRALRIDKLESPEAVFYRNEKGQYRRG